VVLQHQLQTTADAFRVESRRAARASGLKRLGIGLIAARFSFAYLAPRFITRQFFPPPSIGVRALTPR